MEFCQKIDYNKIYPKNLFKIKESFYRSKKHYNPYLYDNIQDYFQYNYKKNKVIQETPLEFLCPTEKNKIIDDNNLNKKYNENKNIKYNSCNIEKDNNKNANNCNFSHFIKQNNILNNSHNYNDLISKKDKFIKTNFNVQNNQFSYNNNYINKLSKVHPYYNLLNYNNFYLNVIPKNTNNYYINHNIIIQNNTYQYPNLYSILNSYNNVVKAINPYLSNNNFNNLLFSKNENNIIDDNYINETKKENTCILEINLKFDKDKNYSFKLKRFDDLFETVQIFCQINELNSKLYLPIVINIIKALNSIYGIYNVKLTQKEINELHHLKNCYYNTKLDTI